MAKKPKSKATPAKRPKSKAKPATTPKSKATPAKRPKSKAKPDPDLPDLPDPIDSFIKPVPIRRRMTFDTSDLELDHRLAIRALLEGLGKKTLEVYRPDDPYAFSPKESILERDTIIHGVTFKAGDSPIVYPKRPMRKVKIVNWLAAGCQRVRYQGRGDSEHIAKQPDVIAWYNCNALSALFWEDTMCQPPGPGAIVGEIVLTDNCREMDDDAFLFLLAHELRHVFDKLKFIVPAFIDWDSYWRGPLGEGNDVYDALFINKGYRDTLDDYGTDNELNAVKEFWPADAQRWFDAFQEWKKAVE